MPLTKTATLTAIFSEVLANLAFMFTDDDQADLAPGDVWLETTIRYEGACRGRLCFRCTRDFTRQLAANLLGIDADHEEAAQKAEDAVKEFMNIVCGQLVTTLYGAGPVFNLSIPQCRELSETPALNVTDDPCVASLSIHGSRIQLSHQALENLEPAG